MEVGTILYGFSQYNDDVWRWLGKHNPLFDDRNISSPLDSWDYIRAVGVLVLAGCEVTTSGIDTDDDECEQIHISFPGDVKELIRRLDDIVS